MVPRENSLNPRHRIRSHPSFGEGLVLFNQGRYFESHEVLEELWREAPPGEKFFLQSLIHFAVALHHHQTNNPVGALLQLDKALRKLAGYLPEYCGLDTWKIYVSGLALRDAFQHQLPFVSPPWLY